jgi:ABC-type transport system substrate-binding protein
MSHRYHGQSRTRDGLSLVFAFFFALSLLAIGALVALRVSVFSEAGFRSVFSERYYEAVLDEATNEARYFTQPTGIDPSVVSGIYVAENGAGDRIYQLSIYQDLVYSDGTPITARDYAFSILLSIVPEVTEIGGSARAMDYLVGYADYVSGAANALAGVRVLDDYTLSITISNEYLPFFYELALLSCNPYPIHEIAPGVAVRGISAGGEENDF